MNPAIGSAYNAACTMQWRIRAVNARPAKLLRLAGRPTIAAPANRPIRHDLAQSWQPLAEVVGLSGYAPSSGFHSGCDSKATTSLDTLSQERLERVKIATFGARSSEFSSVPTETVTWPGIPVFFPKSGLPHVLQNIRVTVFPAWDFSSYRATGPTRRTPSSRNIAPVECPAPVIRWQSMQ